MRNRISVKEGLEPSFFVYRNVGLSINTAIRQGVLPTTLSLYVVIQPLQGFFYPILCLAVVEGVHAPQQNQRERSR